jgi:hypothetical protein
MNETNRVHAIIYHAVSVTCELFDVHSAYKSVKTAPAWRSVQGQSTYVCYMIPPGCIMESLGACKQRFGGDTVLLQQTFTPLIDKG